jgi:sugar lactone lactonase YvrE
VRLRDSSDAPVPGAVVTVTASAGAYGTASAATNAQGNAQISGRVGREVGTHTYTVSAPGASPIQFTVEAVAPQANQIYTLVNVNHLSGTSTVPGPGTLSKLYYAAQAVTAATDGTLYLASYCAVFKLSPAGVLTRIAGDAAESCGFSGDSGPGHTARVYYPSGLALDEVNGFLYIADSSNYRVRQIDLSTGNILTFAGGSATNSAPWGDGGPADQAYLAPSNVSVAPNGDVYISDSNATRIRKVDFITGVISTFIRYTTCDPNELSFQGCYGPGNACDMAWDASGTPFIAGYLCGGGLSAFYGVARVESDGSLVRIAGSPGTATPAEGGVATSASFSDTPAIEFDQAGNLFLTTRSDHRVRRIDAVTRKITTVAGNGTTGYSGEYVAGSTAQLNYPSTLSLDGAGNLYFADWSNYAIRSVWGVGKTSPATGTLAIVGGTGQSVSVDAPFNALTVKVTDGGGANVQGVDVTWERLETGSGLGATGASLLDTKTTASGNSSMTGRVGLATGAYTFRASYTDIHGDHVSGSPQTFSVSAVAPAAGTIFPIVNYVHTSGNTGVPGPATFAKVQSYALGVAAKSDGTMYVADACAVYEVTPRGEISVFAGTPGSCGVAAGDSGPAVGARLYYPAGLALDEERGVLYIADSYNYRVRSVSLTTGVINTFAGGGSTTTPPYGDGGPAAEANFGAVQSVSVGPDGKVYIPDAAHSRIRVVDPDTDIITTFMLSSTACVAGTTSLYSVDQTASVVRFLDDGSAYVSGYLCPGNGTTNPALGIALRATNGTLTRIAGIYAGVQTEGADALATSFPYLSDVIIDQNGDLVVATYSDHRVRRLNRTTGKINTIAGDGTGGYSQPADMSSDPGAYVAATSARLYNPFKLAVTPDGHLLIADYSNLTYRMIW